MKDNMIDILMKEPQIKNLGLKRESIIDILSSYNNIVMKNLLDNGNIELGNGMVLEVVQLLDRVHVLRGVPYKNSRKYKLKLTMGDNIYKMIEEYYDKLQEDIL